MVLGNEEQVYEGVGRKIRWTMKRNGGTVDLTNWGGGTFKVINNWDDETEHIVKNLTKVNSNSQFEVTLSDSDVSLTPTRYIGSVLFEDDNSNKGGYRFDFMVLDWPGGN